MIKPKRNNVQKQKLTVFLRSIISEYPAGGGVLRELCQNADDAGATKLVFVLDEKTYSTEALLSSGLGEYQGPSLLAYNNSIFTEEDFESLSNIGDSRKIQDLSSTGKFGRGFNSVYNWTDCPSIISGDSLVLLDPHESWSASTEAPGGPTYDFVANSDVPEMRNQLAVFESIQKDLRESFKGTIIRLPLRTDEQAALSQICKKPTTVNDIKKVFQKFTDEIVETLLFLKNIRSIILRVGDTVFAEAKAKNYVPSKSGPPALTNHPGDLQQPYMSVLIERTTDQWESSFVTEVKLLQQDSGKSIHRFAVTHHMRADVGDNELSEWARNAKLFPWVAIAAPLDSRDRKAGRLFTSLLLPVITKHPVHIHAMFSITPDRANIHNGDDSSASETSDSAFGARWNKWIFNNCVTEAWLQNLQLLETLRDQGTIEFGGWCYWPVGTQGSAHEVEHGTEVLRRLIGKIIRQNIPLLPTVLGSVHEPTACLYSEAMASEILHGCIAARIPLVMPPKNNRYEFLNLGLCDSLTAWSPRALRAFMNKHPSNFDGLEHSVLKSLTESALEDRDFQDIGLCAARLLPLTDGSYVSFSNAENQKYKLAFTAVESALFQESLESTVDHRKLPERCYMALRGFWTDVLKHTSITRWTPHAAAQYCRSSICKSMDAQQDIVAIAEGTTREWILKLWEWLAVVGDLSVTEIFLGLHLLPLGGNLYRKIGRQDWTTLDVTTSEVLQKVLGTANIESEERSAYFPVVVGDVPGSVVTYLRKCGLLVDSKETLPILEWLIHADRADLFQHFSEPEHRNLVEEIATRIKGTLPARRIHEANPVILACQKLPLFRRANDRLSAEKKTIWSNMLDSGTYFGINSDWINVQLNIGGKIFMDTSNLAEEEILSRIVPVLQASEVLSDHILPFLVESKEPDQDLCWFAVKNMGLLNRDTDIANLSKVAFVPTRSSVKPPCELVHPDYSAAKLLFEDEVIERCPHKDILESYGSLIRLGMVTEVTNQYVLNRIDTFEKRKDEYQAIFDKVQYLFTQEAPARVRLPDSYLGKKWIPTKSPTGKKELCSVQECRDWTHNKLLHYALNICDLTASVGWRKFLHWDGIPSEDLIRKQFQAVVENKDQKALKRLLDSAFLDTLKPSGELEETAWVPGSSGGFFKPSIVFMSNGRFPPYMDDLDRYFKDLFSSNHLCTVSAQPSFQQLQQILKELGDRSTPLDAEELKTVTRLLMQITRRHSKEDFSSIKVPDSEGYMREIHELTAEYSNDAGDKGLKFLHRDITTGTAKVLKIPTSKDRLLQSLANSDDFAQEEDPIVMIKDSLQRYPIEATFDEYLANAEDSGSATEIAWLIDWSTYENSKVLTPELASFQGPSLLSYNNGVFTDKDLKALIRVGVGSKGEDSSKLGRFGRGSLTMYHWTCVPMILSGDYLVVFDPQRKRLHKDLRHKGRCAGTKLRISDVRREYPDQLKPFEGKFGFDKQDHYEGTVFRFPLLADTLDSLSPSQPTLATARSHLEEYFQNANYSLLFLDRVKSIRVHERANSSSGEDQLLWKVSASTKGPVRPNSSLSVVRIENTKCLSETRSETLSFAEWYTERSSEKDHTIPGHLRNVREKYRLQTRYGIAIPAEPQSSGRVFMDLPLRKLRTHLPVSWTADMVLQSNRESLALGEGDLGSDWNKWIIEQKVIPLYVSSLEELYEAEAQGAIKTTVSKYWPRFIPESERSKEDHDLTNLVTKHFWDEIPRSGCRLYRSLEGKRLLRRDEALFNFLDDHLSSMTVCSLLLEFGHKNIVVVHEDLAQSFKESFEGTEGSCRAEAFQSINPAFLRDFLRQRSKIAQLQRICEGPKKRSFSKVMLALLKIILSDDPEPAALEGCYAIPVQHNGMPGMISTSAAAQTYLLEPEDGTLDESLLLLKPELFVSVPMSTIKEKLTEFNVEHATWKHIPILLKGCPTDAETYPKVLAAVWSSIEKSQLDYQDEDEVGKLWNSLNKMEILKATMPGSSTSHFFSLEAFNGFESPLVLQQDTKEATKFINCFPGLASVHRETYFQDELFEEAIHQPCGFSRLMLSLKSLCESKGDAYLEECLESAYADGRIAILQLLGDINVHSDDFFDRSQVLSVFARLRIWPVTLNGVSKNVAAQDLRLAPDEEYDWSKIAISGNFLNQSYQRQYRHLLEQLGVKRVSIKKFLHRHVICAGHVPHANIKEYALFFEWFNIRHSGLVSQYTVAIDGERRFRSTAELYDHNRPAFVGAFRYEQSERFLHPSLRQMRQHVDGIVTVSDGSHVLTCVKAIHLRYIAAARNGASSDCCLYEDAKAVFEFFGLAMMTNSLLRKWKSSGVPLMFQSFSFVPVLSSFAVSYRSTRMGQLVPNGSIAIRNLSEVIQQEDLSIAWSEAPILAVSIPTAISKMLRSDVFLCPKVINHLRYLASIHGTVSTGDIPDFCEDLKKTYKYLDEHADAAEELKNDAVWLNIDSYTQVTKKQLSSSWTTAANLVEGLGHDSGNLRQVGDFLRPYTAQDGLLVRCGMQKVKHVQPLQALPDPEERSHADDLYAQLIKFRESGKYTDFVLRVDGKYISVHRVILAAKSEYFRKMLDSNMAETTSGVMVCEDAEYEAVLAVVEYMYCGELRVEKVDMEDKLDLYLEVMLTADMWMLQGLKAEVEVRLSQTWFMKPGMVMKILEVAEVYGARRLVTVCKRYVLENAAIVKKAMEE